MIASAIKVNVPTAVPRENVTKLELYPSVTHMYSRGIPVYRETTIYILVRCQKTTVMLY